MNLVGISPAGPGEDEKGSGDSGPRQSLGWSFSWMLVGRLVFAASKWGILVIMAKLCTVEEVGQFALGLAIANPVILFANLQLRAVQASDAREEFEFPVYVGLRLATTLAATAVATAIVASLGYEVSKSMIVLAVFLTKVIEAQSDLMYGVFQRREEMDRIAASLIVRGIGAVMVMYLVLSQVRSIFWGLVGVAAIWLATLVLFDIPQAMRHQSKETELSSGVLVSVGALQVDLNPSSLSRLGLRALPLGLVALLLTLNQSIPRLVLAEAADAASLGVFAALAYLLIPGGMLINSLGQAALPQLSQSVAADSWEAFDRLVLRLVGIAVAIGITGLFVSWWIGPQVLSLTYTQEYARHAALLNWIMLSGLFFQIGTALAFAVTATRQFSRFVMPYLMWTGIAVLLSLVLIPKHGLLGAAWTTLGISVVGCVTPAAILIGVRKSA